MRQVQAVALLGRALEEVDDVGVAAGLLVPADLGPCQGLDAVETVAEEMGRLLGWNAAEKRRQVEAYRASAALGQRFKAGAANVGTAPA